MKLLIFSLLCCTSLLAAPSNIFEGFTSIKKPFELRDPFRPAKIKVERGKDVVGRVSNGVYSNIPVLGDVELSKLRVVGVIIGKERRAFIKVDGDQDNTTFTIKEGQILGESDAELKAIMPGGLILVEKTTNIYGQEEYLETVVPISK